MTSICPNCGKWLEPVQQNKAKLKCLDATPTSKQLGDPTVAEIYCAKSRPITFLSHGGYASVNVGPTPYRL